MSKFNKETFFNKSAIGLLLFFQVVIGWLLTFNITIVFDFIFKKIPKYQESTFAIFIFISIMLIINTTVLNRVTPLLEELVKKELKINTEESISSETIADLLLIFLGTVTVIAVAGGVPLDTGKAGIRLGLLVFWFSAIVLSYKIKK